MRLLRNLVLSSLVMAILMSALLPSRVYANGITVSPAIKELTLTQDQTELQFNFTLRNNTDETVTLQLSAVDFGALDETGGVAFVGQSSEQTTKYGLREWMRFSTNTVVLEPNESKEQTAIIDNKESLAPGGHYGAILATPVQSEATANEPRVAVNPTVSVLVLLKKQGGENYSLNLEDPQISGWRFSWPDSIALRFQNAGNVHVVPRGTVIVKDVRGKEVARGTINEDSSAVLPETFRVMTVPLRQSASHWVPGSYTIDISWRYDGSEDLQNNVVKFYFPGNFLYLAIAFFCIMLICYVVLRTIRKR